jgi:hypothetical protein
MLTKKQQQGIKILESIVQSEFPFVVSLRVSEKTPLDAYPTMMGIILDIDPNTLSNVLDIPFDKKFKDGESTWDHWGYYTSNESEMSYLIHLFPDKYHEIVGYKFNNKIEEFITKVYSQLPSNMRVNVYNTTPDYLIPDWAQRNPTSPRTITIERFYIAKDSNRPTRFED